MKVSAALPTGVAALLFESARSRRRLEGRLAALVESRGYEEAILPILDYLEPYEALLTPASRGELYRFIDRDGEQLALRGDFTPMLARLLAPRLHSLRLPLRLFYRGDVVRYEESRPGSRRELYQMGVELLGMEGPAPGEAAGPAEPGEPWERPGEPSETPKASDASDRSNASVGSDASDRSGASDRSDASVGSDASDRSDASEPSANAEREVLALFLEALAGGGGPRQVVLGLAGCLDAALLAAAGDTSPAELAAAVARRERSVVRRACGVLLPIVESGLPERPEDLGPAAAARLRWLLALRDELALRFPAVGLSVDLAEFACFSRDPELAAEAGARSYYDGLVFRAYAGAAAVPVGGGGRYGSLFRALGADIDAVGFSLNLDGMLEAGDGFMGEVPAGGVGAAITAGGGRAGNQAPP
jgi:ATP phosphoribosyltransferase regulatory subunit HisZ